LHYKRMLWVSKWIMKLFKKLFFVRCLFTVSFTLNIFIISNTGTGSDTFFATCWRTVLLSQWFSPTRWACCGYDVIPSSMHYVTEATYHTRQQWLKASSMWWLKNKLVSSIEKVLNCVCGLKIIWLIAALSLVPYGFHDRPSLQLCVSIWKKEKVEQRCTGGRKKTKKY
jgi:hypothetical protein